MACSVNSCATRGAFGECLPGIYCPPVPAPPMPSASPPPLIAWGDPLQVDTDRNGVPLWPGDGTVRRMLLDAPAAAPATYQARLGEYDINERRLDAVHQRELDQWDANEGEFSQARDRLSTARQYQLNQLNAEMSNANGTHARMIREYGASDNAYTAGKRTNAIVKYDADATTQSLRTEASPAGATGDACRDLRAVQARIQDNNELVRSRLGTTFLTKQGLLPLPDIVVPNGCYVG